MMLPECNTVPELPICTAALQVNQALAQKLIKEQQRIKTLQLQGTRCPYKLARCRLAVSHLIPEHAQVPLRLCRTGLPRRAAV